ncbi:hypothetical protein J6590_006306 [Homalodisca vitripennis]|nr:hypothetical protein J6590_006306 [Homalodisca vitripennis]
MVGEGEKWKEGGRQERKVEVDGWMERGGREGGRREGKGGRGREVDQSRRQRMVGMQRSSDTCLLLLPCADAVDIADC